MITKEKIEIYKRYNGIEDVYVYNHKNISKEDFDKLEWTKIDEFIGNMIMIINGKVSRDFETRIMNEIKAETENDWVIAEIEKLALKKIK